MYRTRSYVCAENSKMRNRSPSYAEMSFTTDLKKKNYGKLSAILERSIQKKHVWNIVWFETGKKHKISKVRKVHELGPIYI